MNDVEAALLLLEGEADAWKPPPGSNTASWCYMLMAHHIGNEYRAGALDDAQALERVAELRRQMAA
ncbi:hypothetical protein [Streptomyces olivaceiscleroticus]|uniref:Uncharacterized protein n=1 Tax=Streptomyces olivaceiscleroticus TaxID=68245 RepID=A0ABN1BMZ5_9ACTN